MTRWIKKGVLITLLFAIIEGPSNSAYAQIIQVIDGKVLAVYADPNDVVVQLDKAGTCGEPFFHISRANLNFKELTAVALTAISTAKNMTLFVASCGGTRNILSHGNVRVP